MLKEKKVELCVVDINSMWVYSLSDNQAEAKKKLQDAITQQKEDIKSWENNCKNYPGVDKFEDYLKQAQNKNYQIMTYDKYLQLERDYWIDKPLTEITEDEFHEMLNVLPPLKWCTKNNIEMFCMSEFLTGSFTSQYLHDKTNNKFYHKTVDILDQTTWGHNFIQ